MVRLLDNVSARPMTGVYLSVEGATFGIFKVFWRDAHGFFRGDHYLTLAMLVLIEHKLDLSQVLFV